MPRTKAMPAAQQAEKKIPVSGTEIKELPESGVADKEMPQIGNPENTIRIGDELIEIKPMKIPAQQNRRVLSCA